MVDTWAPLRYVAKMFWELAISNTGGRSTGSEDGTEKGHLVLLLVEATIHWGTALQVLSSAATGGSTHHSWPCRSGYRVAAGNLQHSHT